MEMILNIKVAVRVQVKYSTETFIGLFMQYLTALWRKENSLQLHIKSSTVMERLLDLTFLATFSATMVAPVSLM